MTQSLIRWKKGDYIRLGKAVSDFNKRIRELESIDVDYLPDLKNYKDIKNEILSRNELNRVLKSLRSFLKEGMNKPVDLPSGSTITEWEYQEVKKARKISIKRLESEKLAIKLGEKYVGMGDERIDTINSTIKNIEQFETLKDFEFKDTKERVLKLGSKDYELRKAMIYRENFMNSLGEMSTYDNYDKLVKRLDKISNPIKFYEFIQKSDTLSDLFLYYSDKATAQTYGGFTSNQDAFNYALEELEIM